MKLFFEEVDPLPETPISKKVSVSWTRITPIGMPSARGGHTLYVS